ncbi:MAG: PilZ domain-containing protein [Polyangia bacterium]
MSNVPTAPTLPIDDRRKFPRVDLEATNIRLAASEVGQAKVRIARIVDFSIGGLQVELVEGEPEPRLGSLLDVNLEWPDGTGRFDASVRRVVPGEHGRHRVGIEFDDPDLVGKLLGAWLRSA